MKKRVILIVMVLTVAVSAWAGRIGEQEARKKASVFMMGQAMTRSETTLTRVYLPLQTKSAIWSVTDSPIYIYNNDGGGYVIVSGDDRTADILGFSEKGHIDANHLAVNMKAWLQDYVRQIEYISASATLRRGATTRSAEIKDAIDTKLKTEWGQDYPYNLHTPELYIVWHDMEATVHAATGCVATAMAMVLRYYQYPDKLKKAIDSYEGTCDVPVNDEETGEVDTVRNVKWKTEAIPEGTSIDWANITDKYNELSSDVEKEAVARLMQYCGVAVDMEYGMESSATTPSLFWGLKDVMDYQDVYCLNAFEYDEQGWVDAVYYEMSKAGPVIFTGLTPSGEGHTFILDGYQSKDGEDYFYVNWGWDGEDNGYMLLSVMEPGWVVDESGNPEGFNEQQSMLCGLGPNGKGYTTVPNLKFYANDLKLGDEGKEYSRNNKSDLFHVTDYSVQFGSYHLDLTLKCALGVYDAKNNLVFKTLINDGDETDEIALDIYYCSSLKSDPDNIDKYIPIGKNLDDGTYTVMLICCEPNTENWEPMQNAEALALQMTVSGNKCSFKAGGTTAIRKVLAETEDNTDNAWYSLSGARIGGKPTTKGVYIYQGRKVIVK